MSRRFAVRTLVLLSSAVFFSITAYAAPVKEQGLTALVAAGFEDDEIIAKVQKDGIDFTVDAATIERLKQSGVSEPVIKAIQTAKAPAAAKPGAPLITFESIVTLLENGVESELIIARLRRSAATYTLSIEQEEKLRSAGASPALIEVMKTGPKEADTPEPISDLALVLDVSASMNEQTADGRTKIDVAKEVVGDLVRKIPPGLNVTVVIYGHAPGCSAVKVLRSLAELKAAERESLAAELQSLTAVGNTPIALALRQVGQQFAGRQTYCGVILITDGLESCNGDPAAEAAKLAENPMLRFGVNVLGFGMKPAESAATAEIANRGKGKYYDAQDRAQLLSAVQEVTEKLDKGAEPAPLNPVTPTGKRAIVVMAPNIAMPTIKEIVTAKPEASPGTLNAYRINSVSQYDAELRQPSADPVDVWVVPEKGLAVCMMARFENPERRVVKLRPEDYLGLVRVSSEDAAAKVKIAVTEPDATAGTINAYLVQEAGGFNQDLIVPVGTYMLWLTEDGLKPTILEAEMQVAPGQVSAFEY